MLVVLGVVVFRFLVAGQNDVTVLPKTLNEVFLNLVAATDPVTSLPSINWVYWSLSYEIIFYVIVALGLAIKSPSWLVGLLVLPALFTELYQWDLLAGAQALRPFFWVNYYPLFCIGYFLLKYRTERRINSLIVCAVAIAILFCIGSLPSFFVGLITALLLYSRLSLKLIPNWLDRALSSIGRRSYSLYLIHVPLGVYLFGSLRNEWILSSQLTHVLFDLTNLAFCIVAAAFFYHWVEKPSHRLAREISKRGLPSFLCHSARPRSR